MSIIRTPQISQINDNEITIPEIRSSSIPDNLINFSPTEENTEDIPQETEVQNTICDYQSRKYGRQPQ